MAASTYLGNALLEFLFRAAALTPPATIYVSLHTGDPGVTGANEVSTGAWPAYVRLDAADGGSIDDGWSVAASKEITNAIDLEWPAHDGAGSVTVTHVGLWDAATSGHFLAGGSITASKTIAPTDEFIARAGNLTVAL